MAETWSPSALHTPVAPPVTTPRPVGYLKLEVARPAAVEATPFDFPSEAPSGKTGPRSVRIPRAPVPAVRKGSSAWFGVAGVIAVVVVVVLLTWAAGKFAGKSHSTPTPPTPTPTA